MVKEVYCTTRFQFVCFLRNENFPFCDLRDLSTVVLLVFFFCFQHLLLTEIGGNFLMFIAIVVGINEFTTVFM